MDWFAIHNWATGLVTFLWLYVLVLPLLWEWLLPV